MQRTCDWSGEDYDGTFVILNTTEGDVYASLPAYIMSLAPGSKAQMLTDTWEREDPEGYANWNASRESGTDPEGDISGSGSGGAQDSGPSTSDPGSEEGSTSS